MTPRSPSHIPTARPLWSLREDVELDLGDGPVLVRGRWGELRVDDDGPLIREALDRMSLGPVSLENIPGLDESFRNWHAGDGDCSTWRRVRRTLDQLGGRVVPSLGVDDGGGPLLSVMAERERVRFALPHPPRTGLRLLPGTVSTGPRESPVLIRPGADYRVHVHRPGAAGLVHALDGGTATVPGLVRASGLDAPTVLDVLAYLAGAGLLPAGDPGAGPVSPDQDGPRTPKHGHERHSMG